MERIVRERHEGEGAAIRWIVCPSPSILLAPKPLRHVPCCALLLTAQRTVWMLRTHGHAWTDARLALAAQALAELGEPSTKDPNVARHLAAKLGLPGLVVLNPALPGVDPAQWEIRRLASALSARAGSRHRPASGAKPQTGDITAIERQIRAELESAMCRFVEQLDGRVLAAAPDSLGDIDVYNYLARQPQQRNRLQLASTFPLFVRAAATAGRDGVGASIRLAVDAGLPLVKTLAKQWSVRPSAIRCLLHKPASLVGRRWEADPRRVAVALNALPAELRPGREASAWKRFNELISSAETVFGHRLLQSPLGLGWLRHAARGGWTQAAFGGTGSAIDAQDFAEVDALRHALMRALAGQAAVPLVHHAAGVDAETRLMALVDGYFAAMAPRRLVELARRYRREFELGRAQLSEDLAYLRGRRFWPLLPEDYVSRDGQRRIRTLTTVRSLMQHGQALRTCLAGDQLSAFAEACRRGTAYVLGIFEARSGAPLSTAEIRVIAEGPSLRFRLQQHTGSRNAAPTAECRAAVAEVMELLSTPRIEAHLAAGMRARKRREALALHSFVRATGDSLPGHGWAEAERFASEQAVRRAIGERRFGELLTLARADCAAHE